MCWFLVARHGDYDKLSGGLTLLGKSQARALSGKIQKLSPNKQYIVSSPIKRALETARELFQGFKRAEIYVEPTLKPGAAFKVYQDLVTRISREQKNFVVVGHLPQIKRIVDLGLSLWGRELSRRYRYASFDIGPGQAVAISRKYQTLTIL